MAYNPQNPNGQATMANSAPVVVAIDQSAVPVTDNGGSLTVDGTVTANISGSISNTSFAVTQSTATSLKTQAESYQGGTAVSSTNPLYVTVAASTTGGDSVYKLVSAATTNASNIVTGQHKVTGWYIYNSNASARKVNLYNLNVSPTVGTSTIAVAIVVPGLAATNVSFPNGIDFSTGISISTVTELTDAGTTAVGLNDLIINLFYK